MMKISLSDIDIRRVVNAVLIALWEKDIWVFRGYEINTIGLDGIPEDFK